MTDRELLELAAKAAGITILRFGESEDYYEPCRGYVAFIERHWPGDDQMDIPMEAEWNPLDDDGDAFRLAITLRLCVDCNYEQGAKAFHRDMNVMSSTRFGLNIDEPHIVRRSIVRAAAEIGRAM